MPDIPLSDAPAEKALLRRRFQAYRAGLSPADYAAQSRAIVERARTLPEWEAAATVHAHWPVVARREVDSRPLLRWLRSQGKRLVLPVVAYFGTERQEQPRLRHVLLEAEEALRPNRWGVHEPLDGQGVPVERIDVAIVPALGAGRNGHRIGHGLGYYDEFLATLRAPTVCLVYGSCLVTSVPAEPHDVPVAALVTEDEIVRPPPA